jgi:hypothetical protein
MKKVVLSVLLFVFLSSFVVEDKYRSIHNDFFKKGEHIEYLVHYGFINAGTATVDVSSQNYILNNRICYRVDVSGKSIGAAGAIVSVNDVWRSYVDTAAFVTHRFYRKLEEGNYRREEMTDFNPLTNSAIMKYEEYGTKDPANKPRTRKTINVKTPNYVQDMVSGYYFIRTVDLNKLKEGDLFTVPGILEDKMYNMQIRYKGKEIVKTKFGKIHAHRLIPIMPGNETFKGESSIRFWVSDDKNRVPVRIEADMFIGKVVIEIQDYKNLRHKFNFTK